MSFVFRARRNFYPAPHVTRTKADSLRLRIAHSKGDGTWQKLIIIVLAAIYSAFAVMTTSGLGAVFPEVLKLYPADQATRATDLLTYPTLFMGIGNLLSTVGMTILCRC